MKFTALNEVILTDAYARNGLKKELSYLLNLDGARLLAGFYENSALKSNGHRPYGGGWEGSLIGGHTLGHYLSALAQAYANGGTPAAERARLHERIAFLVSELAACQNNPDPSAKAGFLWGAARLGNANVEFQFDNVEHNRTNIVTEAWVPWYTMHKLLAGLIDACRLAGNAQARTVAEKLGGWVVRRVKSWNGQTRKTVLSVEYGGMNDCLYNLYAVTGNEEFAKAAHAFDEEELFALIDADGPDYLDGRHANTTIPKIIGALNRYMTLHGTLQNGRTAEETYYLTVAEKFWARVVGHHTYITGGNSEWEHFGADDVLDAERTNCNCETCNTYNMLKLSRMLFSVTKDPKYLDYYEGTYYNAIWSSQNPETGMTTYFQPMASGYFKVYSSETEHFWCCTGSGMESFTKLNDSIYYKEGDALYAALYLSSEYRAEGVSLTQNADLEHADEATFLVHGGAVRLFLRRPWWTAQFEVFLNGKQVTAAAERGFVPVNVRTGDEVRVVLQKKITAHNLPDNKNAYAFKYGPFALSAQLGSDDMQTGTTGVNVTIPAFAVKTEQQEVAAGSVADFMKEIGSHMVRNADGTFTLEGTASARPLVFSCHFRQYRQRYALYSEFVEKGQKRGEEAGGEWHTVDVVQPGYGQYEADELHSMRDGGSVGETGAARLGTARHAAAGGSFGYTLAVEEGAENRLLFYLAAADNGLSFKITAGDTVLCEYAALSYTGEGQTYPVTVGLPASLPRRGKKANGRLCNVIDVTVSGMNGERSARLCSFLYVQARTDR